MNPSPNKNRIVAFLFITAFLLSPLATTSVRAGSITVVSLPATGTDAATGISTAKTYLCCLAYGSGTGGVTINSVPFIQVKPLAAVPPVSGTDTTPGHGGTYYLDANHNINSTSNTGATGLADGSTLTMLTTLIYVQSSAPLGSYLNQTYGGLTAGAQYALRLYYRKWSTSESTRAVNIWFNGEGTAEPYAGNPLNEDAGGARYIEYDFTAASTSVIVYLTNTVANFSQALFGMSLEQTAPAVVNVAPVINSQPVGFTNYAGQICSLSVSVSGSPAPAYQWYQNNSRLPGATNAALNFTPLVATNAGSYYVAATNVAGTTNSSVVLVGVVTNPISEEPAGVTITSGQTVTFWVNAVGATAYQWQSNSVSIAGATNALYTTPDLTMAANNASYTVIVTTLAGPTTSAAATLTVVPAATPPTVLAAAKTTDPANIEVVYSVAVAAATALNLANYSLNGANPLSAIAGSQPNVVILTAAAPLNANTTYSLGIQNVQDLLANTIVATNIVVLPGNMSLWLRADAGVVTDPSGNVVQWQDQTPNANNALQLVGLTARPALQANVINGQPALSFDPANGNYLQVASSPSIALVGDMSIYAVVNIAGASSSSSCEILGKTTATSIPASYDFYDNGGTRFYRGNGSLYASSTASAPPSLGVPHVMAVTMGGSSINHYLDGQANGSASLSGGNGGSASTLGDTGTWLGIGSRASLTAFMNGNIAEVMIFNGALSAVDRTNVDNYLGLKYFPFSFAQQPADVVTNQGVTVTFSAVPSQGGAHFNYQWQQNSTNIPNATTASYTTPILAPSDTGATFDVLVYVPGSATNVSQTAHLTVNNVPPVAVSAGIAIWSQTQIVVLFSEAVDPATATNHNNYSLSPSGSVLSAAMGDAPNKVVLTTSPLTPGTAYSLTIQNVRDLFNNVIVSASIPAGGFYPDTMALWLEANAGVTVDGSGYASQWNDQSANGNNLAQPGGEFYAPLLVSSAFNGLPALQFDGTNNYMYANPSSSLAITSDMSVFAVMKFDSLNSAGNTVISKAAGSLADPFDYYVKPSTVNFYRGNGSTYGVVTSHGVPSIGVPHVLGVTMQGTSVSHRLDGSVTATGTLSTTIGDNGSYLFIGMRGNATNQFQGQMAELIVLGTAASSSDTAAIENYLATKYAILLGAPPTITVAQSAGNVVLSWPTPTAPFSLEATPTLPGSWGPVTNAVVVSGGLSTVTLPAREPQMFYHLQKQ